MKEREGKIFNLKPELTLAMKLAATFAITYYGLMLVYEIFTLIYSRYFIDSYYFNNGDLAQGKRALDTNHPTCIIHNIGFQPDTNLQKESARQSHFPDSVIGINCLPADGHRACAYGKIHP